MADPAFAIEEEDDRSELERFADVLGEEVVALRALIAQQAEQIEQQAVLIAQQAVQIEELTTRPPPVAAPPVVNVAPAEAAVTVQASEISPTFAPVIEVQAAPPSINVMPPEVAVNVQPSEVNIQFSEVVAAIASGSAATVAELVNVAAALIAQNAATQKTLQAQAVANASEAQENRAAIERNTEAIQAMADIQAAPKELVLDDKGMPVGIVVKRRK